MEEATRPNGALEEALAEPHRPAAERRRAWLLIALFLLLVIVVAGSFLIGRYTIPASTWWYVLSGHAQDSVSNVVLMRIRLPRILAGVCIGAAVSMSGAAYQGMFRNPMVSPDILGAGAGAALGAASAILIGWGIFGTQVAAFGGSLLAVVMTCLLAGSMRRGTDPVLVLVLVGVIVTSAFSALVSITKLAADPENKLPAITFWLMGSLSNINLSDLRWLAILIPIGALPLFLLRWRLNILTLGDDDAASLGVDTVKLRWGVIVCATLLTATSVAFAGPIAWIGLVVPHLARMLVGPNFEYLLPASLLMGSSYLLLVDDLARSVFAAEIPLSIITALLGAPFFLFLLWRTRRGPV